MASNARTRTPSDAETCETYWRDVLSLPEGQTEEDLNAHLRQQAQQLGISLEEITEEPQNTGARSAGSSRYSASVDSRVSVSTGLTSIASGRDRTSIYSNNDHLRSNRSSTIESGPSRRQSASSATFSVSSTSTNRSFKSPFRRIGLSMLRLHKFSSKGCSHCPKDSASQRRALHEMPCGHRLCTQALRSIIIESIRRNPGAVPQCCDLAIPERFLQHVLDNEEYNAVSKIGWSLMEVNSVVALRPLSLASRVDSLAPSKETERITRTPEYKSLCIRHEAENERFDVWAAKINANIQEQHAKMVDILQEERQRGFDDQADSHSNDMTIAEDRQVKAESDLRNLQEQEIRDNATALKHMEAYCAGTLASGESHNRIITDQDLHELHKTRNMRDVMDTKHANAINILRGEQTRRMKMRAQRHEKEVQQMQARHREEDLALQQRYRSQESALVDDCARRRQRLQARWRLELLICLKRLDSTNDEDIPNESDV